MAAKKTPARGAARNKPTAVAASRARPPAVKAQRPAAAAPAVKPAKVPKLRRKPVRDSFTMPEADFALIATLKARALAGQRETKKSELLRAGLHALATLDRATLVSALGALEPVKIGRPKKTH
jgi:hypothetical protein